MTFYEAARTFLFAKLEAALSIEVYEDAIPQGAALPACVFQAVDSEGTKTQDSRNMNVFPVNVKIVAEGDDKGAAIAQYDLADAALDNIKATYTGKAVEAHWVAELPLGPIVEDGKSYVEHGGRYEVIVRPA